MQSLVRLFEISLNRIEKKRKRYRERQILSDYQLQEKKLQQKVYADLIRRQAKGMSYR